VEVTIKNTGFLDQTNNNI